MPATAGSPGARFLVRRDGVSRVQVERSCVYGATALQPGQARLRIEHFALTANSITYATFGETMGYWQFFPAPEGWGRIPVWGFATVLESLAEGVAAGERFYGFLPMATHLVVQPAGVKDDGFRDGAAHRQGLPPIYNRYQRLTAQDADAEGLHAVLRPLFTTAFLIDDFVAANDAFGAQTLLLSSASSKTAFATAFCLRQRARRTCRTVGLSSAAHAGFARSLGCYDEVMVYAEWRAAVAPETPALYIDFSGDATLRRQVHEHFGTALTYSCAVGATLWQALGPAANLPGPRPALFFAPNHAQRLGASPPEGLGRDGLLKRIDQAWAVFLHAAMNPAEPWLRIEQHRGDEAVRAVYLQVLQGRGDPRVGHMLAL